MTTPVRPLKARLARMAPFFRGSHWGFVLAIVGSIIAAATEPLVPQLLRALLDKGFRANRFELWMVPVAIIGLFAIRGVAGFVAQYGLAWSANRSVEAMRSAMFARLLDAQPLMFTRHSASSLTNTLVYEVHNGAIQLSSSLLTLVRDSLTAVALLIYLLWLNWQLTLIVAVLFPAVALIMRVLAKRLHRLAVAGQQTTDDLAYVVEENTLAWRIVRLHGAQRVEAARFAEASQRLRRLVLKVVVSQSMMTPITQVLAAAALSAVVVLAMWQSSASGTTVGGFVAFVTTMLLLIAPIKHLSDVAGPVTRGLASLERGVGLIDETPSETGGQHDPGRATGHVELREVTLQYRGDQPPALDGVTLALRAGETVALVGPSGAGKSTLVNLLPRFLEPSSGVLMLDGTPLPQWDVHALRRQFALVSQDVVLFNDTVSANVALGAEVDMARVRDALAAANLLDFAEGLPHGLDSLIGHNGSQLSGGQRQRLAIARAIYKDAPILILDEATSALDSESERLVQQALERLMQGRTSLVIAHRLSTIERAHRIVALENGRVIEQGSHAELLAHGGLYARLHALQFRS
ncbi:MAG TPA: lipid A export permease/ATP-binding protein MsbA [Albitalea sp.]|uniref:lipid A export permease/ATP-binding protein MsbA n=1 Tax=Piscinibacter sp. TaxID=1903157 RepID=UPI002ED398A1